MSDRPRLDRCPRCGHDHGRENLPLCLCDCYRTADDQRTGQADTAPQAHIDAVARCMEQGHHPYGVGTPESDARARLLLTSINPDVHAALAASLPTQALLDELERRGECPCGCGDAP